MKNKTYAVVHVDSGIVFAKQCVDPRHRPFKVNNVKIGIVDYNADDMLQDVQAIVIADLSMTKGAVAQTNQLAMDDFIVISHHPYFKEQCDYIFLSHNPGELLKKLNIK